MISVHLKGNFSKVDNFFERMLENVDLGRLNKYGRQGVAALKAATPVDTGLTAESWYYDISKENGVLKLGFYNSNIQGGYANVAILLQYGHATRNGGFVVGTDYINPALTPIFKKLADEAWEEVIK